ncbi:MAG TPA: ABC transporter substrate-binding protein [Williamwhitmania sp.]|nr:ABC transporter substrate-binding protein [Williamwhitmania sp.]
MNRTIKIGFLFPFSTIAPNMSRDIIDGFYSAIPESLKNSFQFYPEYIDKGSNELVKTAINKLIMFHNVDIVSGIVSYQLIPEIAAIIEQQQKIAFFFDLGEYLPPLQTVSDSIFFNSLQMWQLEYALGVWTQKQFSGKGAMLMSVYEAGYHMHSAFWQGAIAAGAEEIDMHILPFNPQTSNIDSLLPQFFEKIEQSNVDYLHALFCGKEALEFFKCFKQSRLFSKIPLVVTPHMATEEVLETIENSSMSLYSASGWNYHSLDEKNQKFKSAYLFGSGKKATEFAVMGYEMGLLFGQMLPLLQKGDNREIVRHIKMATVDGPRGLRNFHHDLTLTSPTIDIEKINTQNNPATKIVTDQGVALPYNNHAFIDIHTQCVSGWKNPYLCV